VDRLTRTLQLPGRKPPLRDLIRDHHRQDQDALQDDDELARHLALDLQRHLTARQDPPQDRREDDADRVVLTEERDPDPDEPQEHDVVLWQVPPIGQDLLHPDQPGERSRDQEQPHLRPSDRDPAGLRRSGRGADGPRLEPQPRPPDHEPDDDRRRDRQEEQPRQVGPGRDAEVLPDVADESPFGELIGAQVDVLTRRRVRELQREVDGPRHEADGDLVHHDRGHDLVGARLHLQDGRDGGPHHASEHRGQ
jgi:hypothetical protein